MTQRSLRMRSRRGALALAAMLLCAASALMAQAAPSDDELTRNLLSAPGPTFKVSDKSFDNHWSFIAYGDTRFTDPANQKVTNPKVRRWLVDKIAAEHPDALLISGDLPYDGSVANDYEVFRKETEPWRTAGLRVYPAIGNHELHGDEIKAPKNWWGAFPELKGRRWYSVEIGCAYVIALDSDLALTEGSRQQAWLVDQLGHLPKTTKYVFLNLHHPPVADSILDNPSHDVRPNEHALAVLLEKQAPLVKARMIVVAGHIHNYQRFYENGVVYLVSGGGGAKPYPIARTAADLFKDPAFPNYHYIQFVFDGSKVSAKVYRVQNPEAATPSWEVKDTFEVPAAN